MGGLWNTRMEKERQSLGNGQGGPCSDGTMTCRVILTLKGVGKARFERQPNLAQKPDHAQ